MRARSSVDIKVQDFHLSLAKWVNERKTIAHWFAEGFLSALCDFGVLQGTVNKKIAPDCFPSVVCV